MGKSLFKWLFVVFGLTTVGPTALHAATLYNGYARVGVPDLDQAVAFFRDVLDCQPLATASAHGAASRLLSCDAGSVIELHVDRDTSPSPASRRNGQPPLRFLADDVPHAGTWLRRKGAAVEGAPRRQASGPLAGYEVLDFTAPWGLRLQLLGNDRNGVPPAGALAGN